MSISSLPQTREGILQLLDGCSYDLFVNTFGLPAGTAQVLTTYQSAPYQLFSDLVDLSELEVRSEEEEVSAFYFTLDKVSSSMVYRVRLGKKALTHEMGRHQQMGGVIDNWVNGSSEFKTRFGR